jgi:SAM-dependent methyltransferase
MNQNPQKNHYETIHNDYLKHYYDATSMKYRDKFIYKYLFKNLNLNNKSVADLACGSGFNSLYLRKYFPDAQLTGFDISKNACEDYKKLLNRPAYEVDLTKKNSIGPKYSEQFDVVMIIGGLHHCVIDLDQTLVNIHQILKPGGMFLMFEPNKNYFLESARKMWYKHDRYFEEDSEEALDHNHMLQKNAHLYDCNMVNHLGGPAYFLIYNSMLFRIPIFLKKIISPPLMLIEKLYNIIPGKFMYPYFVAQWRKK